MRNDKVVGSAENVGSAKSTHVVSNCSSEMSFVGFIYKKIEEEN